MAVTKERLLEEIEGLKKFIVLNSGECQIMFPAKSVLELLECDSEVIINKPEGKNNGHLFITHAKIIKGKYHLTMSYFY